jgi:hypothetical protein
LSVSGSMPRNASPSSATSRGTRIGISAEALPKAAHPPSEADSPPGVGEVGYLVQFERFRSLNARRNQ